jgi:hypothetical protein
MDRESIRRDFRPATIRVLFVGESPPAKGGFFYVSSVMTGHMAKVFRQISGKQFHSQTDFLDFLNFFKAQGCYLDDLSSAPVDSLPQSERRRVLDGCVESLSRRLAEYNPQHVIAVLKSIEIPVRKALRFANLQVPFHAVPFPGHGNQRRFVTELFAILKPIYEPAAKPEH